MKDEREMRGSGPSSFILHPSSPASGLRALLHREREASANLAWDELLARQAGETGQAAFRLWANPSLAVVIGYSERPEKAAYLDRCRLDGLPVLKRFSGGGSVLIGPGVLNYCLTLPAGPSSPGLRDAFRLAARVLGRALASLGVAAEWEPPSDLAVGGRKLSGNSQARRWGAVLIHGTLLADLDSVLLERYLPLPNRQPAYRQGRGHRQFVVSLSELGVAAGLPALERSLLAAAGSELGAAAEIRPPSLAEQAWVRVQAQQYPDLAVEPWLGP